jgi:hypothetical protein
MKKCLLYGCGWAVYIRDHVAKIAFAETKGKDISWPELSNTW